MYFSGRNERGRSRERSPLIPGHHSTSYGGAGPVPRPPDPQIPPPYSALPSYSSSGYRANHTHHHQRDSSPLRSACTTKGLRCVSKVIIAIAIVQFVAFVFFNNLPAKIGQYNDLMAQMRREAKHLEGERIALRDESTRLETERLALESTTLEMEGERQALESAIRRSEKERSRLEKQEQSMEDERQLLEQGRLALRKEREKWEEAREDREIPQGAFWEVVLPAWDCRAYGKREYWGTLLNIPENRTDIDACMSMPVEIKGVTIRHPTRCQYIKGSPHIHAYWMVDWDQPDCKPWLQDFDDKGCTNPGSGIRRIEASVVGINTKGRQDWHVLCESMPLTWNHTTYDIPTHCDERDRKRKVAMWDIPDDSC